MILSIVVTKRVEISKELGAFIRYIFEKGEARQIQINDVLEWLADCDNDLRGKLEPEAEALLAAHGEFYISRDKL